MLLSLVFSSIAFSQGGSGIIRLKSKDLDNFAYKILLT